MKRRSFLAAAAAATLARPAIAAGAKPLIFVPQANLTSLDPVWTTATVTRNFALMVYDMLYGRDEAFVPRPQMVEGHVIDDDGKRWTMTLRDGLLWHDGTQCWRATASPACSAGWSAMPSASPSTCGSMRSRRRTTAPWSGGCASRSRCCRISCRRRSRSR